MAHSKQRQKTTDLDLSPSKTIQQTAFKTNRISSPPRTPPQGPLRFRAGRHNSTIRTVLPETFLDDIKPADSYARDLDGGDPSEDPHDLSLSPRHITRASIVDNMLLSLDQLSFSSFGLDDRPPLVTEHYNATPGSSTREYSLPRQSRSRGHTYSSSLSSDQSARGDDRLSRPVGQLGHGRRRTNSVTDFQSTLARIPSIGTEKETSHRKRVYEAQRAVPRAEQTAKTHRRAVKGSKDSGSSSIDLGDMIADSRVSHRRRSASLDLGSTFQRYMANQTFDSPENKSQRVRDMIDAAPEPAIPAGPRRDDSTNVSLFSQPLSHEGSTRPPMTARESTRTTKMSTKRTTRTETLGTATIRSQEDELQKIRESLRQLPPLPAMTGQLSSTTLPPYKHSTDQASHPKEKPGFLRRVFGSSKTSTTTSSIPPPAEIRQPRRQSLHRSQDSHMSLRQHGHSTSSANRRSPEPRKPTDQQPTPSRDAHVITKKSSFFRRRKKSFSEDASAPPVPLLKPFDDTTVPVAQHSPASSLREVMGPYLADPAPLANERQMLETGETSGLFENTKAAQSELLNQNEGKGSLSPSPNLEVPNARPIKKSRSPGANLGDESFLADSSGNEDTSVTSSPRPLSKSDALRSSVTSGSRISSQRQRGYSQDQVSNRTNEDVMILPSERDRQYSHGDIGSTTSAPMTPVDSKDQPSLQLRTPKNDPGWLSTNSSEEQMGQIPLSLPLEGVKRSPQESASDLSSFNSALSTPQLTHQSPVTTNLPRSPRMVLSPVVHDEVGEEKRSQAYKKALEIFENRDEGHDQAGAWLGEAGDERELVRIAFMRLFDWSGQNILVALRGLCARIALKGESQQVDRLLDAFSRRWCESNPNNGFKSNGTYSMLSCGEKGLTSL